MKASSTVIVIACVAFATAGARAVADNVTYPPLASYVIVDGGIPQPLEATAPGDASRGKAVVADRKLGNCYSCHSFGDGAPDPGNVGPSLAGIGAVPDAMLRLRVVDPKVIDPRTIMPAYYRDSNLLGVGKNFVGKPILTAQQVEDVVAYLASLK